MRSPPMGDGARVKPPLFTSLRGYHTGWLRGDVVAGLTVWAVLVPEALAYASIAGVSPVVGLYAAPGALLLYAAFGSSRHLVTGPMSATAAPSAAAVADVATPNSAGFLATPPPWPSPPGSSPWSPDSCAWASWPASSPSRCSRASPSGSP